MDSNTNLKTNQLSVKLFQSDLYDSIKKDGNHIACLSQEQIRSFLIFAILRHHSSDLHPKYGRSVTFIIVPDLERADDRERMMKNHTDFQVVNLFKNDLTNDKNISPDLKPTPQVVIGPLNEIIDKIGHLNVKLVIFDSAHEILIQDYYMTKEVVASLNSLNLDEKPKLLVFMCSFIHNNYELCPQDTVKLIEEVEKLFSAKCEKSSDLRSISRQAHMTSVKIVEFESCHLDFFEYHVLADEMLREFCNFMTDPELENTEPVIKPDPEDEEFILDRSDDRPLLSIDQQLVLVRSCLSDCIYSVHHLGPWCTKILIKLYITEFSRLLSNKQPVGDLIGSVMTVLNMFYGRLEKLLYDLFDIYNRELVYEASSNKLHRLLEAIAEFKPPSKSGWPICVINVRRRLIAKVIALWLEKLSTNVNEYNFIKPNYIVESSRKHRNRMAVDNFDLHHEAAVRDVRFGCCNVLVSSVISYERSTDIPRCNVVISFDPPSQFSEFIQSKGNCRFESSTYIIMVDKLIDPNATSRLISFVNMEKVLNQVDNNPDLDAKENSLIESYELKYPPFPSSDCKKSATLSKAISIVNRYCAKLPSDSFTKLSYEWDIHETTDDKGVSSYFCEIRLPVNSPVRQIIIGSPAPTKTIAIRLAAYSACKLLYLQGELDETMSPITKETFKSSNPSAVTTSEREPGTSRSRSKIKDGANVQPIGSTRHRQYYKKSIARVFSDMPVSDKTTCYLYKFNMVLTCPIPDEQNRRGRRIVDPGETNRNYAIVCTNPLPKICSFPVFTRSGEVMISLELSKENFKLSKEQVKGLRAFHKFTFSKVLRLEKYPIVFDPDQSIFTVILAPVIDSQDSSDIDWEFVSKIERTTVESTIPSVEERKQFIFKHEDYVDAVVIPWYRLAGRQQFAYYVAEICSDLKPSSKFPDEESGYDTFYDYYKTKYDIEIFNMDQPVLDVDHTSARLNLLTPRYVNRKGRTLPSCTPKSRRESRKNLVQKQLLVPELCTIHPFPASFWRKAVCLPCIFYRLNSLFLAEELRRQIAEAVSIGVVEPPDDFEWPTLDFGWSLKELVEMCNEDELDWGDDASFSSNQSSVECSFGPWKESKDKNQPLLREIYTPMAQSISKPGSYDIGRLFRLIVKDGQDVRSNSKLYDDCPLTSVITGTLPEDINHQLISKTYNSLMPRNQINEDEDIRKQSIISWLSLMKELDNRVEKGLVSNPDLFKRDGFEVVSVDESYASVVEVQPTFGELLPNRDSECNWSNDDWKNLKFDPTTDEIFSKGPSPSTILQALTMSSASDGINLERLETVGDSFLKYSITAYLHCTQPIMHEGKLSYLRSTEISNANLYLLGRCKQLGEIMSATKFEPNDNWLAPGYFVVGSGRKTPDPNIQQNEIDKALAEVPYDLIQQHSIADKSIADCVEALIGAYLTSSGSRAALLFMHWLGLRVLPPDFDLQAELKPKDVELNKRWHWLEPPPSPLISMVPYFDAQDGVIPDYVKKYMISPEEIRAKAEAELMRLYLSNNLDKFEEEIGYTFTDKAFLVQAFTHNSFYENHVTDCHQRLEFLGDALLDYLITRYLFEDPRGHSPGTLTDLRSALVNNIFFASLAVKYQFHKYLQYISDELYNVIDGFVKKFRFDVEKTITTGYTLLISEGESEYAEDIEVPKALGDVFESVAGAIYLDSGMSLDRVWQVYFRMMKPEIEYFSQNVPKSPIRELLESMPQNVRFSPSELAPDRKHRVIAEVFGLGRFVGVGRNKHSAKSTAAKRALRMLGPRSGSKNASGSRSKADSDKSAR